MTDDQFDNFTFSDSVKEYLSSIGKSVPADKCDAEELINSLDDGEANELFELLQ